MHITIAALLLTLMLAGETHSQGLSQPMPVDTNITTGTLSNGLRYYIRKNSKPERRAELRLVVNAGSILEDDDQQGLAHFTEHMAFNGTRNFEKQAIVNYLESVGMRFGADLNAYTSFDETVYMLQIPTDTLAIMNKGFDILEDWSHLVSFDQDEIDKERGVVIEEWRYRRGANARLTDKQLPTILHDSRYAVRLPIGKVDILQHFTRDTILRFYNTWYRPDLMAVVAVGDFDKELVESLIKKHFSGVPDPAHERARTLYPVPDHREPLFTIATDPEATLNLVQVYYKRNVERDSTIGDYRHKLVQRLYSGILNERLDELTRKPSPPFVFAGSQLGSFVRTKDVFALYAGVQDNGIEKGLQSILTEAARVRQHGFTPTELEREKATFLRGMESAYAERQKTESHLYADEYIRNFLTGESVPGIAFEYELYKRFLPTITLEEVNAVGKDLIRTENRVVAVSAPEKPGVSVPTEEQLSKIFDEVDHTSVAAYVDTVSVGPMVPVMPQAGTIVSQRHIDSLDVTEWVLSNGVHVVLKPTTFKNDEIVMTAFSPGGSSLVPDAEYIPAITATSIIEESGVGSFDETTLEKKLAGKIVRVSPYINELEEGFSGSASPADLETLFQLVYLYFVHPRMDSSAFAAYQSRMETYIRNRSARPESIFEDSVQVIMSQHSFRTRPWSEQLLHELNLKESYNIYKDRFADASDFTFIFAGNFTPDSIAGYVKTYLGGLPSTGRKEQWKDRDIEPPTGIVKRSILKGIEPKSQVRIMFTGPFVYNLQNRYDFQSMIGVLKILLRESLREEKGGTYGVGVYGATSHYPRETYRITISFVCSPERVDELTATAMSVIDSLKTYGTTQQNLTKVREIQKRERETQLQQNRFWLSSLDAYYSDHEDPLQIVRYPVLVEHLSLATLQEAARKYFSTGNVATIVLYPENNVTQ
jgi:zinc protease